MDNVNREHSLHNSRNRRPNAVGVQPNLNSVFRQVTENQNSLQQMYNAIFAERIIRKQTVKTSKRKLVRKNSILFVIKNSATIVCHLFILSLDANKRMLAQFQVVISIASISHPYMTQ